MDAINEYDIGAGVVMEANFTKDGEARNPTVVTLTVKPPDKDAAEIDVDVTNPSTGKFKGEIEVTDHGDYYYRFQGTGSVVAAKEGRFRVKKSKFV